jgi:hypothetical protein
MRRAFRNQRTRKTSTVGLGARVAQRGSLTDTPRALGPNLRGGRATARRQVLAARRQALLALPALPVHARVLRRRRPRGPCGRAGHSRTGAADSCQQRQRTCAARRLLVRLGPAPMRQPGSTCISKHGPRCCKARRTERTRELAHSVPRHVKPLTALTAAGACCSPCKGNNVRPGREKASERGPSRMEEVQAGALSTRSIGTCSWMPSGDHLRPPDTPAPPGA